jgi:hypothetical protein
MGYFYYFLAGFIVLTMVLMVVCSVAADIRRQGDLTLYQGLAISMMENGIPPLEAVAYFDTRLAAISEAEKAALESFLQGNDSRKPATAQAESDRCPTATLAKGDSSNYDIVVVAKTCHCV